MFGLSTGEIVLVGMIVFLIFGWAWVPRLAERIGDFFWGVKRGMRDDDARIVVKPSKKDE